MFAAVTAGLILGAQSAPETVRLASLATETEPAKATQMTLTRSVLADGRRVTSVSVTMTRSGVTATTRTETTYQADWTPERMLQQSQVGEQRVSSSGLWSEAGMVWRASGQEAKTVAFPAGLSLRAESGGWFWTTKPEVGAKSAFAQFDLISGQWFLSQVEYRGVQPIVVRGKSVQTHLLETDSGRGTGTSVAFVDDRGLPVRLVFGAVILEREAAE